jgi:PelA/Pel-15E family pectate lyase
MKGTFWVGAFVAFLCPAIASATLSWARYAGRTDEWYRSAQAKSITANVLSWQSIQGGWPKNLDTTRRSFAGDPNTISGTFDNNSTTGELRFLAREFRATQDERCKLAFLKGLDLILKAQYPSGGWPQFYPPSRQYHRHITFNDGSMIHLMELLSEVATTPEYAFVDAARRTAVKVSLDRGLACVLKCQIRVNGKLTVWCAQHDEVDYSPAGGRTYELPSLSGAESAGILHYLMGLDDPGPDVVQAIEAGARWYESAKITGIRQTWVNWDKTIVKDPDAPPLWARFYEIETNRPIFSGRDGVKKYAISEIEAERRNGYSWYGQWGLGVASDYAAWKLKWADRLVR